MEFSFFSLILHYVTKLQDISNFKSVVDSSTVKAQV
jgi:hypothetical protein